MRTRVLGRRVASPVTATTDSLAPDILNKCGRAVPAVPHAPRRTRENRWGAHKKKGRLRCRKRPSLGRKRPRRAAIAGWGWGATAYPQLRRSRPAAQLNVGKRRASKGVKELYEGLWCSPLKPTTSALGVGRHCLRITSRLGIALDLDATVPASSAHHDHWQRSHGIGYREHGAAAPANGRCRCQSLASRSVAAVGAGRAATPVFRTRIQQLIAPL
jgi:hypothetical protein